MLQASLLSSEEVSAHCLGDSLALSTSPKNLR